MSTYPNDPRDKRSARGDAVSHSSKMSGSNASLVGFTATMSVPAVLGILAAAGAINPGAALIGFVIWLALAYLATELAGAGKPPRDDGPTRPLPRFRA
jgi:hypothetical protein